MPESSLTADAVFDEAPVYMEQHAEGPSTANYDCHDEANDYASKPHEMVAFMCYEEILQMRKCCPWGQNLNLRYFTYKDDEYVCISTCDFAHFVFGI